LKIEYLIFNFFYLQANMDQVTKDYFQFEVLEELLHYFWDDKIEKEYRAYERYERWMRQLYTHEDDWAPFDVEYDYKE